MDINAVYKTLNDEQEQALFRMLEHVVGQRKSTAIVARAPGGTGKTYVARFLVNLLSRYGCLGTMCSFTGKAAGQLAKSGLPARTCHSLLYRPILDSKGNLTGWGRRTMDEIHHEIGSFIIVDEASMIPKKMHEELMAIRRPIIYLGDYDQLPPVDDTDVEFNVMTSTIGEVITLQKIERFAEDSGIAFICSRLREQNSIPRVKKPGLSVVPKATVDQLQFHKNNRFDVVLCGTNKKRKSMNNIIRNARGYKEEFAEQGEQIICLRNDVIEDVQVWNGEMFEVISSAPHEEPGYITLELKSMDYSNKKLIVHTTEESWTTEKSEKTSSRLECNLGLFAFGYCISVHKSQGSTFGNVLFYDQDVSFFLDQRRFRYTACSRASDSLTIAI